MIDRYIAPVFTFALLIAGHVAIATALLNGPSPAQNDVVAKAPVVAKQVG